MNSMKRQNYRIPKEELPRSVGAQYATGDQWRNKSRKNEGMEPDQKHYPVVNGTGDRSKVQCCKEQYCIGTWNVRSMNQGKLEVVKQEMARVTVDILEISELKWTGAGVQPQWIQGNSKGDGKNLFNYRYRKRLETDSVIGNISGEKEAE